MMISDDGSYDDVTAYADHIDVDLYEPQGFVPPPPPPPPPHKPPRPYGLTDR
jgi:hypothetical protein